MRIKVSITHSVYLDLPEGVSLEEIRPGALGQISADYNNEETSLGTPTEQVSCIMQRAVPAGEAVSDIVQIRIAEDV